MNMKYHYRYFRLFVIWGLIVFTLLSSCVPITQTSETGSDTSSPGYRAHLDTTEIAVITFVEGAVSIESPSASKRSIGLSLVLAQSNPPSAFQILQKGTVLRLEANGTVTIVCYNNRVYRMQGSGTITVTDELCNSGQVLPANASNNVRSRYGRIYDNDGSSVIEGETRERESDYGQVPVIGLPRNTALLTAPPTITWTAVDGALDYVLSLSGLEAFPEIEVDAQQVICNRIVRGSDNRYCEYSWPANKWQLQTGQRYFLTVSARTGIASPMRSSEPSLLRISSTNEANNVQADIAEIKALQLDTVTQGLLLGGIYANHQLNQDAIAAYEQVITEQPSPLTFITLGDLYMEVELMRSAFDAYSTALLELDKQAMPSLAEQAAAEFGIGLIYFSRANYQEAQPHLTTSLQLYSEIAAIDEEINVQHALEETKKRLP